MCAVCRTDPDQMPNSREAASRERTGERTGDQTHGQPLVNHLRKRWLWRYAGWGQWGLGRPQEMAMPEI